MREKKNERKTKKGLASLLLFAMLIGVICSNSFVLSAADNMSSSIKKELNVGELVKKQRTDSVAMKASAVNTEAEQEALAQQEKVAQEVSTSVPADQDSSAGVEESGSNGSYATSSGGLTPSKGVVYFDGHRETYYSQRVLPGNGLGIPGRHVASDGTIRDEDDYICVASSDLPRGTIVETSLGTGKVYDSGCASGTIDIYTDW